jgi:hypothetical protein
LFSSLYPFYKDFFFNVFNITHIENNENVKYSTKNNKIYDMDVFLAVINKISAMTISRRNFMVTAARVNNACADFSFNCPLKKIINAIREVIENEKVRMMRLPVGIFVNTAGPRIIPPAIIRRERSVIRSKYLMIRFTRGAHLIKSLMAVYMAVNTPRRDSIIVNTGVSRPKSLSSFIPPQTVIRMMTTIWTPSPVYFA